MSVAEFGTLSNNFATANLTATVGYSMEKCILEPFFWQVEPYSSGFTYNQILLITSAITTVLCLIFSVSLATVHLSNWVKPQEQKQHVRIILFPTVFAFFNLFAVWFHDYAWVLTPFPELYECFALVAMFYLIVVYVSPNDDSREEQFRQMQRVYAHGKKKGQPKHDRGSLRWFRLLWVGVFQVLPIKLLVNLAVWITSAVQCPLVFNLSKQSLAIEVVQSISTSICIASVISFARRLGKPVLGGTGTRSKLISFKGIVGITLTQTPIFTAIASYSTFHRTKHVSVLDFTVGTPAFMTCVEMFLISIVFCYTFTAEPYLNLRSELPRCRSVSGAFLEVLDIRDILRGCWYMTKIVVCCGGRTKVDVELEREREKDVDVERFGQEMDLGKEQRVERGS